MTKTSKVYRKHSQSIDVMTTLYNWLYNTHSFILPVYTEDTERVDTKTKWVNDYTNK